jgi:hypothetical protein
MNRIINFTNKESDLDALPDLRRIYQRIFSSVKHLDDMNGAFNVACDCLTYVYNNLEPMPEFDAEQVGPNGQGGKTGGQGQGQDGGQSESDMLEKAAEQLKNGDYHGYQETMDDIKNTDWDKVKAGLSNQPISSKAEAGFQDLTPQQAKTLNNALKRQKEFMNGQQKKVGRLTKKDASIVNAMEESGVSQVNVGGDVEQNNWRSNGKNFTGQTQVLFVKKITQQMIDDDVFPSLFARGYGYYGGRTQDSITNGKKLGTMLGKKLQVRSESRTLKNSRLDSGRIDKRLIAELGFGNSKVFQTTFVENYNDAIMHISVDASGSMGGDKWRNTMTAVVAICKAASMISGLDVVVSFRTTHHSGNRGGQPLVAIGYDSRVDKFRKIEQLWPNLYAGGTTPEGLCYEAIMKDFVPSTSNRDSYFLNFSDGMPMFGSNDFDYYGDEALQHTKRQVKEITKKGISVLSYFIGDSYDEDRNMEDFKTMYGKDAEFVDVSKVSSLAKTMNNLFLEKGK